MPENSIVNTPQNTSYFTKFTQGGKGFKIIRSNVSLQDISSTDFSSFDPGEVVDPNFGADSSYFFESQQFKLNPCKTVLTKESLPIKGPSKSAFIQRPMKAEYYREKSYSNNTNVPSFSRFYKELKNLKKVDPNMRTKLSFTYFC